ncbi:hypothetical protein PGTUg99_023937 [Puccinia graminis f. sp. tritici]|uniref:Uncharacterized protein n=1 Tax=Puccinia graminis f. sp. tritici TaxID=56615 RepID=A0A5B0R8S3_PUCGR|nr:hypothetical protein PGTUg99_023937 [Puccinia graminis f. sp. tritici]
MRAGIKVCALPPIKNEPPLGPARESLYVSKTGLVTSARVATSASPTVSCPTSPEEEEADSLLASATAVLRSTNSCMDAVSACLTRMDPGYAEFELSSNWPSFHAYFNTSSFPDTNGSLSMRSRHTLSMLGRKASALAFTRNPFEPENQNNWSAVSQNWKKSDTSSIEPSAASDVESLYTPDTSFMAQTKEAEIKQGTQAPRTSPSLSTLSSSDGIDLVRASPSTANSSDGRYSRESSPATSTSVSHPEEESAPVIDRHPTPAQRPNPKALALPPLHVPARQKEPLPTSWHVHRLAGRGSSRRCDLGLSRPRGFQKKGKKKNQRRGCPIGPMPGSYGTAQVLNAYKYAFRT